VITSPPDFRTSPAAAVGEDASASELSGPLYAAFIAP